MSDPVNLYEIFGLPPPAPFHHDLTIHVAESHNELRLIFVHYLTKVGFSNIRSSKNGLEALEDLKNNPSAIALIGHDLEKVSGIDLTKELSESTEIDRPAHILVTSPPDRSAIMEALEAGVDDFLVKPVVQGDILSKMKSAYKIFHNPKNPERVYELAKRLIRKERFDKAFEVYTRLSELNLRAARPHVGLARILSLQNKFDAALAQIAAGITKNPNYVHAYQLRGDVYLKMGEKEKAIEDLQQAIKLSPRNISRYDSCCQLLLSANNIKGCISVLDLATQSGVQDSFITERLGHCHFLLKEYSVALRYLREAVHLDPENVSYLNSLAICYRDDKNYEKAIETYNRIIKKDPGNHLILFNKAVTLKHMKKIDEAIKLLERVIELDPSYHKAQEQLDQIRELKSAS